MSLPHPFDRTQDALVVARARSGTQTLDELKADFKAAHAAGKLAFRCVPRSGTQERQSSFLRELDDRAANPFAIRQGSAPLCGPAAFLYCVAKSYPEVYQRYVLELAIHGHARLGKLNVSPSQTCRDATPAASSISPVDWVALASLRDSTNAAFRMNGPESSIAGITLPNSMRGWFEKSGLFSQVEDHTSLMSGMTVHDLLLADRKHRLGFHVCMLVRASVLGHVGGELGTKIGKDTPKTIAFTPDHWVVQASPVYVEYKRTPTPLESILGQTGLDPMDLPLSFSTHSWGYRDKPLAIDSRVNPMSPRKLLPYFYGFVSAKPA